MITTTPSRLHNKSGLSELTLLTYDDSRLENLGKILAVALEHGEKSDGLLPTQCCFTRAADGRLSHNGKKQCYGYQLVALRRYKRAKLQRVTASKSGRDFSISHLCGSLLCCTPEHLYLETKRVNDERTHCHFVLQRIRRQNSKECYRKFVEQNKFNYCEHTPRCGMPHEEGETASEEVQEIMSTQE